MRQRNPWNISTSGFAPWVSLTRTIVLLKIWRVSPFPTTTKKEELSSLWSILAWLKNPSAHFKVTTKLPNVPSERTWCGRKARRVKLCLQKGCFPSMYIYSFRIMIIVEHDVKLYITPLLVQNHHYLLSNSIIIFP